MASEPTPNPSQPETDLEAVACLGESYRRIREELAKVIVGQDQVIEQMMIALFCRGHCMLECAREGV